MYVCLCKNVTEKDIKRAVLEHGAYSVACLEQQLEVATCCGQCRPVVANCLESALDSEFRFGLALTV